MDFRAHADEVSGGKGWGEQGLETGALVTCEDIQPDGNGGWIDKGCGKTSKLLAIEKVTLVRLELVK
jgi:hypothetical protein